MQTNRIISCLYVVAANADAAIAAVATHLYTFGVVHVTHCMASVYVCVCVCMRVCVLNRE